MKKLQFLLLDVGPIIKLFEIGLWEKFIEQYDVTIARTVVEEAVYTDRCDSFCYIDFPFEQADEQGLIKIIDKTRDEVKDFLRNSGLGARYRIDPGEAEPLAFLMNSADDFILCTADGAVFSTLGFLNKAEKGISLEELLRKIGLTSSRKLEWRFTKKFRDKYTTIGQIDSAQGKGLV